MATKVIDSDFKVPVGKILLDAAPANMEWKLIPKEKSEVEKLQEQLAQAEAELAEMREPSQEELIAEGMMTHPYYWKLREKQEVENLLKQIQ
jgi:hypothetical protein